MIKTDLATSIGVAILGVILSYVLCNLLIGKIEPVSFQTIDSAVSTELAEPNPEVFNYKALNPTVEVYVGNCTTYDSYGECADGNQRSE